MLCVASVGAVGHLSCVVCGFDRGGGASVVCRVWIRSVRSGICRVSCEDSIGAGSSRVSWVEVVGAAGKESAGVCGLGRGGGGCIAGCAASRCEQLGNKDGARCAGGGGSGRRGGWETLGMAHRSVSKRA